MPVTRKPAGFSESDFYDMPLAPSPMMVGGPLKGLLSFLTKKPIPTKVPLPPPDEAMTAGARLPEFTPVGEEAVYNAGKALPKPGVADLYRLMMERFNRR